MSVLTATKILELNVIPLDEAFEDDVPVAPGGCVAVRAESGALLLGNKVLEFCRCAKPEPMTRADIMQTLGPIDDPNPVIARPCPENEERRFKEAVGFPGVTFCKACNSPIKLAPGS